MEENELIKKEVLDNDNPTEEDEETTE